MLGRERSLPELSRLTREALETLAKGIADKVSSLLTKLYPRASLSPWRTMTRSSSARPQRIDRRRTASEGRAAHPCLDSKLMPAGWPPPSSCSTASS